MKHIITAICLSLSIMTAAVALTLAFKGIYYTDAETMDLAGKTGYSYEEIIENYDALIAYNQNVRQAELELTIPISKEAEIHFADVKYIFVLIQYVLLPIGLIGTFFGIKSIKKEKPSYEYLKWTSIFTIAIPAVLGCFVFAGWELVFELFHEIFFRNDYWLFDPAKDPIINLLPSAFFLHCAIMILALVLASGIVCLLLYKKNTERMVKMKPVATMPGKATPFFRKKK